jgi:regulator of protease activity HflC (stomatin/prohibitin superfamily)
MTDADSGLQADLKEIGPLGQSVALTFRFLFIAVCVLACGWLVSNVRQVPADSQAVVMRFGSVARIKGSGLVLAFPRPIEQVVLVPALARQIGLPLARFTQGQSAGASAQGGYELARDPALNAGFLLTGDLNVVHLDAQIFYQVSDPAAYMVQTEHVRPALQRLFIASAISVIAGRGLDSILVARPEMAARRAEAAERERLRADIMAEVNARLAALGAADSQLGVLVSRVDLVPSIPAMAKSAFDNVLSVAQGAETTVARARTAAQFTTQDANSKKDKVVTSAAATAQESITNAKSQTASIATLGEQTRGMSRGMQMTRLYQDRINALLPKAAGVDVVDPQGGAKAMLPGVSTGRR